MERVQIEPPPKPFLANHCCYSMSTWVWVVDSEEPDDDKPKEVWFATGASQKRKRSKKGKWSRNVTVPVIPVTQPAAPMEYPGDPTEQEVIDNVRGLPNTRSGGKVISCFLYIETY